jgi:Peptidase A4 family
MFQGEIKHGHSVRAPSESSLFHRLFVLDLRVAAITATLALRSRGSGRGCAARGGLRLCAGFERSDSSSGNSAALARPVKDLAAHADGTFTSSNWSGYLLTGSGFTSAEGSWTVPAVTCAAGGTTKNQYSAFWVGLDGYIGSNKVEQIGTESNCEDTTPQYYAWYELYPNPQVVLSGITIAPGDQMSASVVYKGMNSKGLLSEFDVTIQDVTTGKSFTRTIGLSTAPERASAEWIAEAPTSNNTILPLADFGTALFGQVSTGRDWDQLRDGQCCHQRPHRTIPRSQHHRVDDGELK